VPYYDALAGRCIAFFSGFEAWNSAPQPTQDQIVERALDRYRDEYLRLAALLGEHLAEQNALARLEDLTRASSSPLSDERATIAGINRAVLTVEHGYVEPGVRWAVMRRNSRPSSEQW
jgi:hypothetical protein